MPQRVECARGDRSGARVRHDICGRRGQGERPALRLRPRAERIDSVEGTVSKHVYTQADAVAESVLYRRAARLGSARVLHELRAKGLSDDVVAGAAEQLRATELSRARQLWRTKFGNLPEDAAERARQMRFLAARGFAGDVIRRALAAEALGEPLDNDDANG